MTKEKVVNVLNSFVELLMDEEVLVEHESRLGTNARIISKPLVRRFFVELLNNCNLLCKHCYAFKPDIKYTKLDDVDRLIEHINEALTYGVYKVDVTGGEPFLYKKLDKLLHFLTERNCHINLYSNFTLLTEERLDMLEKFSILSVVTSIDGLPAFHDDFRGKIGAWNSTMKNIERVVERNIPIRVNIIATEENIHELKELCELLNNKIGVTSIVISTLFDVGRQQESKVARVSNAKLANTNSEIHIDVKKTNYQAMARDANNHKVSIASTICGIGKDMVFLNSAGQYSLCPTLTYQEGAKFYLGELASDSFSLIVERLMDFDLPITCEKLSACEHSQLCLSGCRSRAFLDKGSMSAIDEVRCEFFDKFKKMSFGKR